MAATVLITGSTPALKTVMDEVNAAGAQAVSASSPEDLTKALESVGKGNLKHFIQLPQSISAEGAALVTTRVHESLKQGLLSRYRTAEAVLPYLSDDARVILVSGNVISDPEAPDDRSARLSLVHVLRHAMLADKNAPSFEVKVADASTTPARIVDATLTGASLASGGDTGEPLDYDDWRTEMLGGMREF